MIAMIEKFKSDDDGVSPVIGVILLVAVTVALVALATVIVFDIGSDVSDTADATVQLSGVDNGVQATVVRNENVDSFLLSGSYDDEIQDGDEPTLESVGDTVVYLEEYNYDSNDDGTEDSTATLEDGDTISVIASLEDGSEEVLTSTQYNA